MAKKKETEITVVKASGTTRLPHNCHSPYQDSRYGRGMRIWNIGKTVARCTVCGEEKRK
jgi:hypothetical protein